MKAETRELGSNLDPCIRIPVRISPAPAPRHDNHTSLNNDLNATQNCQCPRACFVFALTACVTCCRVKLYRAFVSLDCFIIL